MNYIFILYFLFYIYYFMLKFKLRKGFEVGEQAKSSPYPRRIVFFSVGRWVISALENGSALGNRLFHKPLGRLLDFRVSGFTKFNLRTRILITSASAIRAYIPCSFWRFFTSYKVNVRCTPITLALTVSPHNSVCSCRRSLAFGSTSEDIKIPVLCFGVRSTARG